MRNSYIDYAMSVIVSRALPDVRDGLKPVHRRILYAMQEAGMTSGKPYKKSARIVGEVLGKYHPHGDSSVYDAIVRMAQDFSMRYMLADGHGNFGSVDGDPAAAMRYTEVRMSKISELMLQDIDKDTVEFIPNYDESLKEPAVLPSKFPELLVNGTSGIAVGMATNSPPHNLGEVIDGVLMLLDNSDTTIEELMTVIKGPDFPTGGLIMGTNGIRDAYTKGRGAVKMRAKAHIEPMANGKNRILVTELPYQVNKARLIEKIAELARDKEIDGITDLRDESDRKGMCIVIELRKDVNPDIILNQLYKHTQLQDTFGVIMLALVNNQPRILNLKQVLHYYILHQEDVITRRTKYELEKAQARAHILEGLNIALDHIDAVITTIRESRTADIARSALMSGFGLTDKQAQAILDLRLQRLTGLEREKIEEEYQEILKKIEWLQSLLADEGKIKQIIKEELLQVKAKFGDERRTTITYDMSEMDIEDLIADE
ncbi:MAG: DNA topoisomerase 4 subunit A, partial [Selenomonadaceae bacterium]|nr:DNA topoisomerase 4 subunit A [Selenomonadaceae bacterium]